jgi:type I restriction enzyme S subunit
MKYKLLRYEEYKDSGVEWIGKTPFHWEVTRNKDIFQERGSLSDSGTETLLTVSHITGVTRRTEKNVNMFMAETMEGYKLCEKGDLIINTMWAWMGALGTCNEKGICSPAYGVYKPRKGKDYCYRYFDYLYRTPNSIMEMTRNSKGIVSSRLRLYSKEFFQMKTSLPSYATQKAIANYLDTKTAQIDRKIDLLIQKTNKYGELKQSLINETVTHGLDKTVSMKDSGIEWIGEVPEHWNVKRLKDISANIYAGGTPSTTIESYWNKNDIVWLPSGELQNNIIKRHKQNKYISFDGYKNSSTKLINSQTTLIALTGATCANIGYLTFKACANQSVVAISNNRLFYSKYLFYYLLSKRDYIKTFQTGGAQAGINTNDVKFLYCALPPLCEQRYIAEYLDEKTCRIEKIVQVINNEVEKLKELRKALINGVVTGKIKVFKEGE